MIEAKLQDITAEMAALFIAEIIRQGKVSSGKLVESITPRLEVTPGGYELQVLGETYAIFINKGRPKGAKRVPISALIQWLEIRGYADNDRSIINAAFAIQKHIFENGIKAVPIIDDTVSQLLGAVFSKLQSAFVEDVELSLFNTANWKELQRLSN